MKPKHAFTLIELLVVIAIIAIISAFLFPALSSSRGNARRMECLGNLRQVNLAIRLYADDFSDSLPVLPDPSPYPNGIGAYYKQVVKGYAGLTGPASVNERQFTCPADQAIRIQWEHAYTSFTFNGYETGPDDLPRITGKKLFAIVQPARAVLVGEWTAFFGGSWHPPRMGTFHDASSVLSFVDGHAGIVPIFWDGIAGTKPADCTPPASYDYSWDGN
jgi:prepilin-type N-terminal cleavage/methylation domain-containing protein